MVLIGLGANLPSSVGEPEVTLRVALKRLAEKNVEVISVSTFHRTSAWPDPSDPPYTNAVALIATELSPDKLMALLHFIETELGRHRSPPSKGEVAGPSEKNGPRSLDLDLLDYEGIIQQGPPVLPHPRMTERNFVLVPLAEIAPDWRDPVSGKTVMELMIGLPPVG